MPTIKIRNMDGGEAGALELSDEVFGIEPNAVVVSQAVHNLLANRRAGTHSTRTRGMVRGGGKKPWKQKGTGRARQGSIRAVQWRGGAIAFGPHPRDYSYKMNRKAKRLAMRSVLSDLLADGRILPVEGFAFDAPKTSRMAEVLDKLGVDGPVLLLADPSDVNVLLSARNLPYVKCVAADSPNVYDLLSHDYLVTTPAVLKRLEGAFA